MGKCIFGVAVLLVCGLVTWLNYVGFTKQEIHSPDGKFVIKLADVGFNGGTLLRLSTKRGWPLYSRFYHWAEKDGVPYAFEWFPDAVAMIDHFDLGTSLNLVALPSGQPIEFLSQRETEVREALRWKYSFTDYRKMIQENKTTIDGTIRIYTNDPSEGFLDKKPVWFSDFAVLFKLDPATPRDESILSATAFKTIEKSCNNPNLYLSAKASFENQLFHAFRISCHKQRAPKPAISSY